MSTNSTPNFSRLIRFQTSKESPVFIGQPKDNEIDVGLAALDLIKAPILVELFSGNSSESFVSLVLAQMLQIG